MGIDLNPVLAVRMMLCKSFVNTPKSVWIKYHHVQCQQTPNQYADAWCEPYRFIRFYDILSTMAIIYSETSIEAPITPRPIPQIYCLRAHMQYLFRLENEFVLVPLSFLINVVWQFCHRRRFHSPNKNRDDPEKDARQHPC